MNLGMMTVTYTCRRCWGPQEQVLVNVSTVNSSLTYVPGRWLACERCGNTAEPIEVRPARPYVPPLVYVISCNVGTARFTAGDDMPEIGPVDATYGRVYCGPAADLPAVPTPDDILAAAGLQAYARHPHTMGA